MPDGKRKRRFSQDAAKRKYYANYRSWRFNRRFGLTPSNEKISEKNSNF